MKTTSLLFVFVFITQIAFSQVFKNDALYVNAGINTGNYLLGHEFGLNYIHNDRWSLGVHYNSGRRFPQFLPDDYRVGILELFRPFSEIPMDRTRSFRLTVGRVFYANKKRSIRINAMGGIASTNLIIADNWRQQISLVFFANYEFDYRHVRRPSVVINPQIELCFNKYYGISISSIMILNDRSSYFGLGLNNIIGFVKGTKVPCYGKG